MRLVSFNGPTGLSWGVATGGGVRDLGRRLGQGAFLAALVDPALAADAGPADWTMDQVVLLPPVPQPSKILCVGVNYADHAQEMGRDRPEKPVIFTRFADTLVGHRGMLQAPRESAQFDYEGELAVVIGRGGRAIPEARALDHVAGYACFQDATARDWQRHTHQFTPGKNFPGTGGFGPWIVTRDEVPDPQALTLVTRVEGVERQRASTAQMIFPVAELIAYLSRFTVLGPGDVIATGTPSGVGVQRKPQVFLAPGNTVEVEIEGVGTLVNGVVADT
ncbi:fumarylacetoacetate hydrolase family protein [Zavarzinia sp. CC-PAN008]|uniref:fumarylacetoacetate hydrolase family protein n=1 Tax=Zavarzinia sp. CC-PAN008 TaxID=3243332 RepID=UPI003F74407F